MALRSQADDAIYTALNVAAVTNVLTGGVWNTRVPQGTAPPYGVFSESGGSTSYTFDKTLRRRVYLVRAIVRSQWPKDAATAFALMAARLHNRSLTVTGGEMLTILEEAPFDLAEDVGGGVFYYHVGAYFGVNVDEVG
jgi:hypothetical protein